METEAGRWDVLLLVPDQGWDLKANLPGLVFSFTLLPTYIKYKITVYQETRWVSFPGKDDYETGSTTTYYQTEEWELSLWKEDLGSEGLLTSLHICISAKVQASLGNFKNCLPFWLCCITLSNSSVVLLLSLLVLLLFLVLTTQRLGLPLWDAYHHSCRFPSACRRHETENSDVMSRNPSKSALFKSERLDEIIRSFNYSLFLAYHLLIWETLWEGIVKVT